MSNLVRRETPAPVFPSLFSDFTRDDFFRPFEQMFDEIVNQVTGRDFKPLKATAGYPRLDVLTHDNKFVVEVAIPGVNPSDVHVEIEPAAYVSGTSNLRSTTPAENDILHITGHMETVRQDANYHVRELSRKAFRRSMYLPKGLKGDPEAIFRNGLLTLTWEIDAPTPVKPENKVIEIKTG